MSIHADWSMPSTHAHIDRMIHIRLWTLGGPLAESHDGEDEAEKSQKSSSAGRSQGIIRDSFCSRERCPPRRFRKNVFARLHTSPPRVGDNAQTGQSLLTLFVFLRTSCTMSEMLESITPRRQNRPDPLWECISCVF